MYIDCMSMIWLMVVVAQTTVFYKAVCFRISLDTITRGSNLQNRRMYLTSPAQFLPSACNL